MNRRESAPALRFWHYTAPVKPRCAPTVKGIDRRGIREDKTRRARLRRRREAMLQIVNHCAANERLLRAESRPRRRYAPCGRSTVYCSRGGRPAPRALAGDGRGGRCALSRSACHASKPAAPCAPCRRPCGGRAAALRAQGGYSSVGSRRRRAPVRIFCAVRYQPPQGG